MAFKKLKARRYAFRVQQYDSSSTKPRRVKLIAQRRIFSKGKTVTAGTEVNGEGSLNVAIAKAKVPLKGAKLKASARSVGVKGKVGNKWAKPLQNR